MPIARLKRLTANIYEPGGNLRELDWRMRRFPGETTSQRLDNYLNATDPEVVVTEHVFGSPSAPERAFSLMRYGYFPTSFSQQDEPKLVRKIMWKLGFEVPEYPLEWRTLADNLNNFREISSSRASRGVEDILRIRSASVNFFVALEEFLSEALKFTFWMLTSDHYIGTKFSYDKNYDQTILAGELLKYQSRAGIAEPVVFSADGKNTLYPLISGFRILAAFCREIIKERSKYVRPDGQFPGFVGRQDLEIFPFQHTKLLLDLRDNVQTAVLAHLVEITELLEGAGAANIRNRLEHAREDFPSAHEISELLNVISSLVDRMHRSGFSPSTYVFQGVNVDKWGRRVMEFGNYRNDVVRLHYRAEVSATAIPNGPAPIIIVPLIKLGDTEEVFRVSYTELSDFRTMWKEYPIKRFPAPGELETSSAGGE